MELKMRFLKNGMIALLLFSSSLFAQISLDYFLSDSLHESLFSIKSQLVDKKLEERQQSSFNILIYYDWIEPISVKISLLFNKDSNVLTGKGISNVKDSEDAQTLFNKAMEALVKKYGPSINNTTLMGMTTYSWSGIGGSAIVLSHKDNKTTLLIMVYK